MAEQTSQATQAATLKPGLAASPDLSPQRPPGMTQQRLDQLRQIGQNDQNEAAKAGKNAQKEEAAQQKIKRRIEDSMLTPQDKEEIQQAAEGKKGKERREAKKQKRQEIIARHQSDYDSYLELHTKVHTTREQMRAEQHPVLRILKSPAEAILFRRSVDRTWQMMQENRANLGNPPMVLSDMVRDASKAGRVEMSADTKTKLERAVSAREQLREIRKNAGKDQMEQIVENDPQAQAFIDGISQRILARELNPGAIADFRASEVGERDRAEVFYAPIIKELAAQTRQSFDDAQAKEFAEGLMILAQNMRESGYVLHDNITSDATERAFDDLLKKGLTDEQRVLYEQLVGVSQDRALLTKLQTGKTGGMVAAGVITGLLHVPGVNAVTAAALGAVTSIYSAYKRVQYDELMFKINESKGIQKDTSNRNLLQKVFTVDWNSVDTSHDRVLAYARIMTTGAVISAVSFGLGRFIHNPGEFLHDVAQIFGGAKDHASSVAADSAHQSLAHIANMDTPKAAGTATSSGLDHTGCFVAGTLILMADGTQKVIEAVEVGEKVYSYDEITQEIVVKTVEEIVRPIHEEMVVITFANGTKNTNTFDHPYFIKEKGWASYQPELTHRNYGLEVEGVVVGDIAHVYTDGRLEEVTITSIQIISGKTQTYNLSQIADTHTFFANGILVHNKLAGVDMAQQGAKATEGNPIGDWWSTHPWLPQNGPGAGSEWSTPVVDLVDNKTPMVGGVGDAVGDGFSALGTLGHNIKDGVEHLVGMGGSHVGDWWSTHPWLPQNGPGAGSEWSTPVVDLVDNKTPMVGGVGDAVGDGFSALGTLGHNIKDGVEHLVGMGGSHVTESGQPTHEQLLQLKQEMTQKYGVPSQDVQLSPDGKTLQIDLPGHAPQVIVGEPYVQNGELIIPLAHNQLLEVPPLAGETQVSIHTLFEHNQPGAETHSYADNMNGYDHYHLPNGITEHAGDANDKLLGTWQGAHTAFDPGGKWVDFYGTYPGAKEFIQIDGHYYTFDPQRMILGSHADVTLTPVDGAPPVHLTQDAFLHLAGYGDPKNIEAGSIVNQTYQQWAALHNITGTMNASDRLAQVQDPTWLANHPGFAQMLQQNLSARGLTTGDIHYTAVPYGEAIQNGNHLTIIAQNQYVDAAHCPSTVSIPTSGSGGGQGGWDWGAYKFESSNGPGANSPFGFFAENPGLATAALLGSGVVINAAVNRIRGVGLGEIGTLYQGRRINNAAAISALALATVVNPAFAPVLAGYLLTIPAGALVRGIGYGARRIFAPTVPPSGPPAAPAAATPAATPAATAAGGGGAAPGGAGGAGMPRWMPVAPGTYNVAPGVTNAVGNVVNAAANPTGREAGRANAQLAREFNTALGRTDITQADVENAVRGARDAQSNAANRGSVASIAGELAGNIPANIDLTDPNVALAMAQIMVPRTPANQATIDAEQRFMADAIRRAAIVQAAVRAGGSVDRQAGEAIDALRDPSGMNEPVDEAHIMLQAIALRDALRRNGPYTDTERTSVVDAFADRGATPAQLAVVAVAASENLADPATVTNTPADAQGRIYEGLRAADIDFRSGVPSTAADTVEVVQALTRTFAQMGYIGTGAEIPENILTVLMTPGICEAPREVQGQVIPVLSASRSGRRDLVVQALTDIGADFDAACQLAGGLKAGTVKMTDAEIQRLVTREFDSGGGLFLFEEAVLGAVLTDASVEDKMSAGIRQLVADRRFANPPLAPRDRATAISDAILSMRNVLSTPGRPVTLDQVRSTLQIGELSSLTAEERGLLADDLYTELTTARTNALTPPEAARFAVAASGLPDGGGYNDEQVEIYYNVVRRLSIAIPAAAGLDAAEVAIRELGLDAAEINSIATTKLVADLRNGVAVDNALRISLRGVVTETTPLAELAVLVQEMARGATRLGTRWTGATRTAADINTMCTRAGFDPADPDDRERRAVVLGALSSDTIPNILIALGVTTAAVNTNPEYAAVVARGLMLSRTAAINDIRAAFRDRAVVTDAQRPSVAEAAYDALAGVDQRQAIDLALVASGVTPDTAEDVAGVLNARGVGYDVIRPAMEQVGFTHRQRQDIITRVIGAAGIVAGTRRGDIETAVEEALAAAGCPARLVNRPARREIIDAIRNATGLRIGDNVTFDNVLDDYDDQLR